MKQKWVIHIDTEITNNMSDFSSIFFDRNLLKYIIPQEHIVGIIKVDGGEIEDLDIRLQGIERYISHERINKELSK